MQCTRHNVPLHVSLNIILRLLCVCVCVLCDVPLRAFEFLLVCVYLTHSLSLSLSNPIQMGPRALDGAGVSAASTSAGIIQEFCRHPWRTALGFCA